MKTTSNVSNLLSKDKRDKLLSQINQLHEKDLMECFAFWMGNDPIKKEDLDSLKAVNPFVFVGTSIFGSISLACNLAENLSSPPQVVIVDISPEVAKSWELIKSYFSTSEETTLELFLKNFIDFLKENRVIDLSMDLDSEDSYKKLETYLLELMNQYGFERVKQMTNDAVILKQSWADKETFQKIREIYGDTDIYAYPSNIIHSIRSYPIQKDVAECIKILRPVLSIQTNLVEGAPKDAFFISKNTKKSIMRTLGPSPFLSIDEKRQFGIDFLSVPKDTIFHQEQQSDENTESNKTIKQDFT